MKRDTIDFGIDLGTTNSAVTLQRSDEVYIVPSVVRIAPNGLFQVGEDARPHLGLDAANTHAEFKRLMGTTTRLGFEATGRTLSPEELSAEVLKALKRWVRERYDEDLESAVITVPALFEIPQNEATERAAALAGIRHAPLLQEPIAAALAYGFDQKNRGNTKRAFWLVYDFGGGTFDASLVSLRDGRLSVVDHDGDNFLGGKDLDKRLLDLIMGRLRDQAHIPAMSSEHPEHIQLTSSLRRLAEKARVDLSQKNTTSIELADILRDEHDSEVDLQLELHRQELDRVILPELSRSVDICQRLLDRNRLSSFDVGRLVLVGGVTQTPLIRSLLRERLGIELECELDPAKTVAIGAALHASSIRRETRAPRQPESIPAEEETLRLEYPAVSQDLTPYVVGRFPDGSERPEWIVLSRDDGQWSSGKLPISDQGAFMTQVQLDEGQSHRFELRGGVGEDETIDVSPNHIELTHGLSLAAPPLSRSLGVGLADNSVHVYLSKGASLPAQATHLHRTTTSLEPGHPGAVIDVPVVQGESERADRNRHIGSLCIPATRIKRALPLNSEVEVSVEVDSSSTVRAKAYVPFLDQIFEQVLSTKLVAATAEELEQDLELAFRRKGKLEESPEGAVLIAEIGESQFDEIIRDIAAASLGDNDSALRAQRRLLELHERLDGAELDVRWPRQVSRAHRARTTTGGAVEEYGGAEDQELFDSLEKEVTAAIAARDLRLLERKVNALWRLRHRVLSRRPEYWIDLFWWLERRQETMLEPERARRLVEEGKQALDRRDYGALERIVLDLDALVAPDDEDRPLGLKSHVR